MLGVSVTSLLLKNITIYAGRVSQFMKEPQPFKTSRTIHHATQHDIFQDLGFKNGTQDVTYMHRPLTQSSATVLSHTH